MRIIKFEKVYLVGFRNKFGIYKIVKTLKTNALRLFSFIIKLVRFRIEFGIYKIVKTLKTNALHLFSFITKLVRSRIEFGMTGRNECVLSCLIVTLNLIQGLIKKGCLIFRQPLYVGVLFFI
jgi:hypothetical protein